MSRFFIDRPVLAMVIAILIVLGGIVTFQRLPVAQFPDIAPPEISIRTLYVGADALTIEESVATPIEQLMTGVDNMIYMRSYNVNDGTMNLRVDFEVGTDPDTANVLAYIRLAQAIPQLPSDVQRYGLSVLKAHTSPLAVFALYSPRGTYDGTFLANYAYVNINDPLTRVPGIGQVTVQGAGPYAMRLWVRPDELAKLGITVTDIASALEKQNVINPSGQVGAEPAPPGQEFTYTMRAQGRLVTPEEFADVIIRANRDGSVVRVRDVARVELGAQTYNNIGRLNGAPAAIINLFQLPGFNAVEAVAGARRLMEDLKTRFPADMDYTVSLDTTLAVTESIREIYTTLGQALLLVILVVFLFLQSWRATLIPALTVPVSLIGTFIFFPLLGFSVNTLSLFGLVLAIGLVVDDAIVVVEAVEKKIEEGLAPREATIRAMDEVSGPVAAIALILAAVFVPTAFVPGITGRLYQQFAVTIAVSVAISAFNALSLTPALCALLLRPRPDGRRNVLERAFARFNRGVALATDGYVRVCGALVRKAPVALLLLAVIAAATGVLGWTIRTGFLPTEDQGYFYLNVQLPEAASLQRTDAVMRRIEHILKATPGVQTYSSITGYSLLDYINATYFGFFFVSLAPWEQRRAPALGLSAIMDGVNAQLDRLPGARAWAFPPPAIPGVGTSGGFSLMLQDRAGRSVDFLAQNVNRFLDVARKRPELSRLNSSLIARVPQVYARVERDKALKQGVDIEEVYRTLKAFMGSLFVNYFNRFGRQWQVYVGAEAQYRARAEDVGQFYVRNSRGEPVPLSALVSVEMRDGPEYTNRFNEYRSAEITGGAAPGYSSAQAMAALEEVARVALPAEMGHTWNALSYQQRKAAEQANPAVIFGLSLLVVFLILAAQYESWALPWSVLLGTPIAVFGAFLALRLRGLESDVYAQIGLVMLIGLAAKNAILIVEFARTQRQKGAAPADAALTGARLRLRPILMTAFAFILGTLPLALATGSGAAARRILGTAVIGGMLAATLIAVFLIPVTFYVVERLAGGRGRVAGTPAPAPERRS
jgi:hydrophobic/amphiphilic exporter-1 (mainly G- bacteria), HAE1 family